ncbi:hypothetical protein EVJ58_g11004 [Rhodofomes roseus]|uniref:Glycosyl hydrolase family 88 n=1 Tax=Rhodofomes roseus TaxID=34475 RepID=A0A4Y9XKM7_9APHY|nr:hypothetical protein EVJ58_g11004 [Rhodofomes roseus]
MVPPFLAYYGVLSSNQSLVQEAYNQVKLYRSYLYNSSESLWQHILLGTGAYDPGYWSTGNGWAAAGMVRVLATIQHSQFADTMVSEMKDLSTWIVEIHTGMYSRQDASTSLFHNYANNATWFLDSSSTALLASTVYRLAALQGVYTHIPHAEAARAALSASAPAGESEYTAWGTGDGVGPATSFTQTTATATTAPASRSGHGRRRATRCPPRRAAERASATSPRRSPNTRTSGPILQGTEEMGGKAARLSERVTPLRLRPCPDADVNVDRNSDTGIQQRLYREVHQARLT